MGFKGCDQTVGPKQEDARIPEMTAIGEHRFGRCTIRLFHETPQGNRNAFAYRTVKLKIAIARLGACRFNAEGNDMPSLGRRRPGKHGHRKPLHVMDEMIRRRHQKECGWIAPGGMDRRRQDRRSRVLGLRFDENRLGRYARLVKLITHQKSVGIARHHQRRTERHIDKTPGGSDKQAFLADQGSKLFRASAPRDRPKAGSRSTAQKHRADHRLGARCCALVILGHSPS